MALVDAEVRAMGANLTHRRATDWTDWLVVRNGAWRFFLRVGGIGAAVGDSIEFRIEQKGCAGQVVTSLDQRFVIA